MTKLFEYQGKELLRKEGIPVPEGVIARSVQDVREASSRFPMGLVLKAQILTTGRGKSGGIRICHNPAEASELAEQLFGTLIKGKIINAILIEEKVESPYEFFVGITLDDQLKGPVLILSLKGGVDIEEIAKTNPAGIGKINVDYLSGLNKDEVRNLIASLKFPEESRLPLLEITLKLYETFKKYEMTALEINPFFFSVKKGLIAGDCKITVDDYGVFRHPEVENMIEIPREFSHAPTELEKIAWMVEKDDYRGTFYFGQLIERIEEKGYVAFHGGGGGGSMACMDKLVKNGLKLACYVDTSGNPAGSKIYKAIKIILSIPGIEGYIYVTDAVANQDLAITARALIKVLREIRPKFPTIFRLIGYNDHLAKGLVEEAAKRWGLRVEYYADEVTTEYCIKRMKELIKTEEKPENIDRIDTLTGEIVINLSACESCVDSPCVSSCPQKIFKKTDHSISTAFSKEEIKKGRCIECLSCELACHLKGNNGLTLLFPLPASQG